MVKTLLSIFEDRDYAESAIRDLENAGFDAKDLSIVMRDQAVAEDIGSTTGANVANGAVSGAATGGLLGGLAGLLIGIGAIAVPGVGALLIGGPLAAALGLTGAAATTATGAVTGAVAGGLLGALMGLGVPEEQARVYEDRVREGAILLAVPVNEETEGVAMDILRDHYAEQISEVEHEETTRENMVVRNRRDNSAPRFAFGSKGGRVRRAR